MYTLIYTCGRVWITVLWKFCVSVSGSVCFLVIKVTPSESMRLVYRVVPPLLLSRLWRSKMAIEKGPNDAKQWTDVFSLPMEKFQSCLKTEPFAGVTAQMGLAFFVMDNPFLLSHLSLKEMGKENNVIARGEDRVRVLVGGEDDGFYPHGPLGNDGLTWAAPKVHPFPVSHREDYGIEGVEDEFARCKEYSRVKWRDKGKDEKEEASLSLPSELQRLALQCIGPPSSPRWKTFVLSRMAAFAAVNHPDFYRSAAFGERGPPSRIKNKTSNQGTARATGMYVSASSVERRNRMNRKRRNLWWPASRCEVSLRSKGQTALSLTHEDWVGAAVAWQTTLKPVVKDYEKCKSDDSVPQIGFAVDVVDIVAVLGLHHRYPSIFHRRMLPQCWLLPPSHLEANGTEEWERWKIWIDSTTKAVILPSTSGSATHQFQSLQREAGKERVAMKANLHGSSSSSITSSFIELYASNDIKQAITGVVLSQHWSLRECIIKLIGISQRSFPYCRVATSDVFTTTSSFLPSSCSVLQRESVLSSSTALPLPRGVLQPFQVYQTSMPVEVSCRSTFPHHYKCSSLKFSSSSDARSHSDSEDQRLSVRCMSWIEWYAVDGMEKLSLRNNVSSQFDSSPPHFAKPHSTIVTAVKDERLTGGVNMQVINEGMRSFVLDRGSETTAINQKEKEEKSSSRYLPKQRRWEWRPHVITVAMSLR